MHPASTERSWLLFTTVLYVLLPALELWHTAVLSLLNVHLCQLADFHSGCFFIYKSLLGLPPSCRCVYMCTSGSRYGLRSQDVLENVSAPG